MLLSGERVVGFCSSIAKVVDICVATIARGIRGRFHEVLVTSALLSVFSSPPFYFFPPLSVGIVSVFTAVKDDKDFLSAALRMLAFYGGYCLAMFHWFVVPMFLDVRYFLMIPFALASIPIGFGLVSLAPLVIATGAFRQMKLRPYLQLVFVAISWFVADYIRAYLLFGGMPWQTSGLLFSASKGLLSLVRHLRQWHLDLIAALLFAFPLLFVNHKNKGLPLYASVLLWFFLVMVPPLPFRPSGLRITVAPSDQTSGTHSDGPLGNSKDNFPVINIYGLQGNVPQDMIYTASLSMYYRAAILDNYIRNWNSFRSSGDKLSGVIVIPEGVMVFYETLYSSGVFNNLSHRLGVSDDSVIMFPSIVGRNTGGKLVFQNATSVISGNGDLVLIQPKKYLVPFGEYVPIRKFLPEFIQSIVALGDLKPANSKFPKHIVYKGIRIATVVCYEIAFDNNLQDADGNMPDLVISMANDGWIRKSLGLYQHLAFARLRAAMLGVPVFHIVNNGHSALIDSGGRVVHSTPFGSVAMLQGNVIYSGGNG